MAKLELSYFSGVDRRKGLNVVILLLYKHLGISWYVHAQNSSKKWQSAWNRAIEPEDFREISYWDF